ncbi:MAG: CTP synthase [Candidatus Vogelbacteria bacterium RIFOXYD1_FULL_44_32]|uniref:CTP synthase n=1 Tax=Candidatus Vogelbacteria bacterium RIFOXYD1_FULL_44_32 TaxID=1802438 RepID=A0A1G2QCC2_9BACT|nr:MAG: CTP synthase [Candidatus Vogelbacteria bacterium RIFOXYD1_FULL_44_32]
MKKQATKYIFVVGGVMSGVGKGITSSSIGAIMQARGFVTTAIKIDPYINVDAGTMNPTEHGEVFVLDDGDECDQDMGNYERFLGLNLSRVNYMTTGRVYQEVIRRERNLEYGGKNVQVVPDVPLEAIRRIEKAGADIKADVVVVEVGGTVGEYENILFLEAARMMKFKYPNDVAFVMVSYVPIPSKVGEMKTKPTQHASRTLNSVGVQADVIIARSEVPLDKKRKDKIAIFCNLRPEHVISAPDVDSIYDVPVNFERDKIGEILSQILKLPNHRTTDLTQWKDLARKARTVKKPLNIAVVGKYFDSGDFVLSDVYISVLEALKLSAYHNGIKPVLTYINSKNIETGKMKVAELAKYDGILVPGGFGTAGIEGIIKAIQYAREKKIPYFGLCYGMQLAVIEYARHMAGITGATSREINPEAKELVIDIMEEQKKLLENKNYGGTMRLGAYPAYLKKGTIARGAYKAEMVSERHRHRYEVNNAYVEKLEKAGLVFSGTSPSGKLMEIAELPKSKHPFFLGTQFHPEFTARPFAPHPLFTEFVKAAKARSGKK